MDYAKLKKPQCGIKLIIMLVNLGVIMNHDSNLFSEYSLKHLDNCVVKVQAIRYEPFVINETSGIEIDIIQELGKALKITFEIIINEDGTYLGEKDENGTWTGFVEPIYKFWHWGVGNIAPDTSYITDFTYSEAYYSEKLVWVVPVAALIPRWRVLMVIFTLQMWGICFALILGFAAFLYVSKKKTDGATFNTFEKCFAAAFQLLISVPVPKQPKTDCTRVFFIALAIFGIIMGSIYTCSLVYYLQNPIREQQIQTFSEIASSGLMPGGPPKYRAMFMASKNPDAKTILSRFQTVNDSLDSYTYWLNLVGNKRNMATIAVKLCVNYLLSKKRSIVTNQYGDPKVYITPKAVRSQSIGIMMRRGSFLKEKLNLAIQKLLVEAGVAEKIKWDYIREGKSDDDQEDNSEGDNNNDKGVTSLSVHHLEGAFAILALGHVFGILILIIEICYFAVKKKHKKRD